MHHEHGRLLVTGGRLHQFRRLGHQGGCGVKLLLGKHLLRLTNDLQPLALHRQRRHRARRQRRRKRRHLLGGLLVAKLREPHQTLELERGGLGVERVIGLHPGQDLVGRLHRETRHAPQIAQRLLPRLRLRLRRHQPGHELEELLRRALRQRRHDEPASSRLRDGGGLPGRDRLNHHGRGDARQERRDEPGERTADGGAMRHGDPRVNGGGPEGPWECVGIVPACRWWRQPRARARCGTTISRSCGTGRIRSRRGGASP